MGSGPRVVLVHGSVAAGRAAWARQAPLAARWRLVIPDRRGFGASAHLADAQDCVADARDVAELLDGGAHLVGHSYGALGSLLAAAGRPGAVRSLAVIEPPCFGVVRGDPAVERFVAGLRALVASGPSPIAFLEGFARLAGLVPPGAGVGVGGGERDEALERAATVQLRGRWPWDVDIPVADLATLDAPKLVLSGDHDPVFEAVCDALADRIGAERSVVPGDGHAVAAMGRPLNDALERFWRQSSCQRDTASR